MEDLSLPSGNLEQRESKPWSDENVSPTCRLTVVLVDSVVLFGMRRSDLAPKKLSIDLLSMDLWERVQETPVSEGAVAE